MPRVALDSLNLAAAEKALCEEALACTGSIRDAAAKLGISVRRLQRLLVIHRIEWPRPPATRP